MNHRMSRLNNFPLPTLLWMFLLGALAANGNVWATDFYVDPVNGSPAGDGSAANPWGTLEEVWDAGLIETQEWDQYPYNSTRHLVPRYAGAPVKAGDTLYLLDGYHGEPNIQRAYNSAPITIAAAPGQSPKLGSLGMSAVQNWVIQGLSISPSSSTPPVNLNSAIVSVNDHNYFGPTWDVELADNDVFGIDDASNWGVSEWMAADSGITVRGDRVILKDNKIRNTRFALEVVGDEALISHNVIDGFSADGMRGLGDYGVYEYNLVKNNYVTAAQGDSNHDDGFQSWSRGPGCSSGCGEVTGVVLRGNTFISTEDPNHPLRSTMQGIGAFDGFFVDWVVENNVIITDHWHGITFLGMRDSRIVNNTVIDINNSSPGPPWIMVAAHKDGTPSENIVVRNNLAHEFNLGGVLNLTEDHNIPFDPDDADLYFVDAPYDVHLNPSSPAIDAGSSLLAPVVDAEGTPRPQGDGFDVGAYEFSPTTGFAPADFNKDGKVDGTDLGLWETAYGITNGGDADGDGDSDGADFLLWQRQYTPDATTQTLETVPEPSALLLAACFGLIGVSWNGWRTT